MDKEQIAMEILENVVAKELQFILNFTEHNEDGSFSTVLSDRSQRIVNGIVKVLERYE